MPEQVPHDGHFLTRSLLDHHVSDNVGMAYRPPDFSGCAVAVLLFVFVGVPLLALLTLGESSCDMHIGPPCAISWGWVKLINVAVVVAICLAIGVLINVATRRRDNGDGSKRG